MPTNKRLYYNIRYPFDLSVYTHVINATIDKGSIVWVPQMKVVWEPRIIIDKRGLFSLLLYQMLTSLMLQDD